MFVLKLSYTYISINTYLRMKHDEKYDVYLRKVSSCVDYLCNLNYNRINYQYTQYRDYFSYVKGRL